MTYLAEKCSVQTPRLTWSPSPAWDKPGTHGEGPYSHSVGTASLGGGAHHTPTPPGGAPRCSLSHRQPWCGSPSSQGRRPLCFCLSEPLGAESDGRFQIGALLKFSQALALCFRGTCRINCPPESPRETQSWELSPVTFGVSGTPFPILRRLLGLCLHNRQQRMNSGARRAFCQAATAERGEVANEGQEWSSALPVLGRQLGLSCGQQLGFLIWVVER